MGAMLDSVKDLGLGQSYVECLWAFLTIINPLADCERYIYCCLLGLFYHQLVTIKNQYPREAVLLSNILRLTVTRLQHTVPYKYQYHIYHCMLLHSHYACINQLPHRECKISYYTLELIYLFVGKFAICCTVQLCLIYLMHGN